MELIPPRHWNHVQGSDNPADCASRGLYPEELKHNETWWYGPSWLRGPQSHWPATQELLTNPVPCEERKGETELSLVGVEVVPILSKISNFTRLFRITAWMMRLVPNARLKDNRLNTSLTNRELTLAHELWIRRSQNESFATEIASIKKGN